MNNNYPPCRWSRRTHPPVCVLSNVDPGCSYHDTFLRWLLKILTSFSHGNWINNWQEVIKHRSKFLLMRPTFLLSCFDNFATKIGVDLGKLGLFEGKASAWQRNSTGNVWADVHCTKGLHLDYTVFLRDISYSDSCIFEECMECILKNKLFPSCVPPSQLLEKIEVNIWTNDSEIQ